MISTQSEFCFCTLALGDNYCALALDLIKDLAQYSPATPLVLFTDRPENFKQFTHVLVYKHQQQSIACYHDKRVVIEQAIRLFNTCIFLDADMRILAPVPQSMNWINVPGVAAKACESLTRRYSKVALGQETPKIVQEFDVVKKAAQKFGLDYEDQNIQFVYEYLFAVTRDSGKELEFLKQWEVIAPYFELQGVYDGEGASIALAAAKAGLSIRKDSMEGISFFKERIERIRIRKGESSFEEMAVFFERQKKLEYPHRSLLQRAILKLKKKTSHFYRQLRLRITTLRNYDFYYR